MPSHRHVVVIGGGASGLLVAARLLDVSTVTPLHLTVVEPTGRLGAGVAYGTDDPDHLVNVRASAMSADPSRPDELVEWVAATGGDSDTFVARRDYRRYLHDHLSRAVERAVPETLSVRRARVDAVARSDDLTEGHRARFTVHLDDGGVLLADKVVLAIGNPPPGIPEPLADLAGHPAWVPDPWAPGAMAAQRDSRNVLLVGSGLTMVDTAITLEREHRLTASAAPIRLKSISRSGLLPKPHLVRQPARPLHVVDLDRDGADVLAFAERLRARGQHGAGREYPDENWREMIDAVRPYANALWRRFDDTQRQRFLDHLSRDWDVHRHRMAPLTAQRIEALRADGRLELTTARLVSATPTTDGRLDVSSVVDGQTVVERFDAVVNCTGPGRPWSDGSNPLVNDLLRSGLATRDDLGLGLRTDAEGALVGGAGRRGPGILVIGPPRRGSIWETTAIPELRSQALHIADRVVGGGLS